MSQIIAGTYELSEQIGAGGGGIVYLGRHLRLDKPIVLKADKRTLSTRPEVLRREVDALKNISHTYIPQVYDFVAEGGVVYTVMDYIEGESLDKPLKRGERFPQAQVIGWAYQLLDALCYLHGRPPHGILHSDIKPANIMLTPQGDIRLIDFNIALALGEEGTVRVGYSRGYASPEHYGADLFSRSTRQTEATQTTEALNDATEVLAPSQHSPQNSSGSASGRGMTLDARSDIYSLGATLYHLLTGVRPAQDAARVIPITGPGISPAVAAIIRKAMEPDPERRYQSAQEMLKAFQHLHEDDPRAKRHKRQCAAAAAALSVVFLMGGLCTFLGLRQMEREQAATAAQAQRAAEEAHLAEEAERTARQALAAIGASEEAYREGNRTLAAVKAVEALNLDSSYTARAQKALTDALGVYDLKDGFKPHGLISLPSEPLDVRMSPSGARTAVMTLGELLIFDTETGTQLAALSAVPSAQAEMAFVDEDIILFAGAEGLCAYNLSQKRTLWTGEPATGLSLNADGSAVAAVYRDEDYASVYDVHTGALRQTVSFRGKRQNISGDMMLDLKNDMFALDGSGTHLAVSFPDGSLWVYDLQSQDNNLVVFDGSEGATEFWGGFCRDGLAVVSNLGGRYYFGVVDVEEAVWSANFPASSTPYRVGIWGQDLYISLDNVLVRLDLKLGTQIPAGYTDKSITAFAPSDSYMAVASQNGMVSFFAANDDPEVDAGLLCELERNSCNFICLSGGYAIAADRDTPALQVLKLEGHEQNVLFRYDPQTTHREARVSADGTTVMLFWTEHFALFDKSGMVLAEVDIPEAGQIYDQQYRREGPDSYLEVIYFDGLVRTYSASDGTLQSEQQKEKPDESIRDEFLTDRWRISSGLHGTPTVYDRETGEELGQLLSEDYLTYVTQTGDWVITEYITTQGERYGLLLNEERETLAYLPGLCDITPDGTLVFDDMLGNLRQSRIYSIQELIALAEDF